MASLYLENVIVDFPIYGFPKSFRAALRSVGGSIRHQGGHGQRVTVRALDSVSISLKHGDRLGIIGLNGSGKSTLLRVCAGVYEPSSGKVRIEGKVSPLFNISPGLDLDDTGYENIMTCGFFLGMTQREIENKLSDIEQFSELGEYLSLPVRTYSSGMLLRLGFAVATTIDPEILILDEGLGVGDARFADRAKKRVDELIERSSILILASHSEKLIKTMCTTAILLNSGRVITHGPVEETVEAYRELSQQSSGSGNPTGLIVHS